MAQQLMARLGLAAILTTGLMAQMERRVAITKGEIIPLEERHEATVPPGKTLLLHFRAKIKSIHLDTPGILEATPTGEPGSSIESVELKGLETNDPDKRGVRKTRVVIFGDPICSGDPKCSEEKDAKLYDAEVIVSLSGLNIKVFSTGGLRQPWYYTCLQSRDANGVVFPCNRFDERQAQPIPQENRSEQIIHYDTTPRGGAATPEQ